jgi:signal transduction histidine kinase
VFWGSIISRTLVPFGFLLGLLRLRMARGAVAELVVDLGEIAAPERLREALAEALGDPGIEVCYWSRPAAAYVTASGAIFDPLADRTDRATVYLERGDEPLAVILHDPALADDPGLLAAVAAAVRLAVENERLTAEVEAQLAEVHASRARIVAAGDAERRRVERDLHDGAQQRLVAMSLALRLARAKLGSDADPEIGDTLDQAAADAKAALSELRELARGIHPQILTQAGLGPAIATLATRSPIDVTVDVEAIGRYDAAVESTGYFVVSEALANVAKYAHAEHAAVRGRWQDDVLTLEVSDDGVGGADPGSGSGLRGLIDRLAAIDGTLEISSPSGAGTRLQARIPTGVALPV